MLVNYVRLVKSSIVTFFEERAEIKIKHTNSEKVQHSGLSEEYKGR